MSESSRAARRWTIVIAFAALAGLHVTRLDYSPLYLLNDEIFNGLQAWSLANTRRSVSGDFLPCIFAGSSSRPAAIHCVFMPPRSR